MGHDRRELSSGKRYCQAKERAQRNMMALMPFIHWPVTDGRLSIFHYLSVTRFSHFDFSSLRARDAQRHSELPGHQADRRQPPRVIPHVITRLASWRGFAVMLMTYQRAILRYHAACHRHALFAEFTPHAHYTLLPDIVLSAAE